MSERKIVGWNGLHPIYESPAIVPTAPDPVGEARPCPGVRQCGFCHRSMVCADFAALREENERLRAKLELIVAPPGQPMELSLLLGKLSEGIDHGVLFAVPGTEGKPIFAAAVRMLSRYRRALEQARESLEGAVPGYFEGVATAVAIIDAALGV